MKTAELGGKRVIVLGAGREGQAMAKYAARHGAIVTLSDLKSQEALADAVQALADVPINWMLGGHPFEMLEGCDALFASPGVPRESPIIQEALRRGIPISGEACFFLENCAAPIIGITGSSGKTTTTRLTGEILSAAGFKTWTGGNIGAPLTPHLDEIQPTDKVVMELSSFQLQVMDRSPTLAAILNITPNHLDRHPTMEDYIDAKAHILRWQKPSDVAVLNHDNALTRSLVKQARGQVALFSMEAEVAEGAFLRHDGQIVLRLGGCEQVVVHMKDIQLLGPHNVANVLAACAVAGIAGATPDAMRKVILSFRGVEHRLEPVREINGVIYYNDSIATSPERAAAALRSFNCPIVLLAGGQDKHLPWDDLAALMLQKTRAVILFGQAADIIDRALAAAARQGNMGVSGPIVRRAASLQDAVLIAHRLAQPGDVVLLSPGGTSFDAFKDFVERGEYFKALVRAL